MTESMPETASQPGLILKTAREEMSLSIEQVAQELHLRPAVVKALEEENYSEFNSDVFLKGYFRTYCRLVKLHEDRMVEILDKQLGLIKDKTESAREQEIKALLSRKRRKTIVTILVFLVCAGLIAFTYYLATNSSTPSGNDGAVNNNTALDASSDQSLPPETAENQTTSSGSADVQTLGEEKAPVETDEALPAQDVESITNEEFEESSEPEPVLDQELDAVNMNTATSDNIDNVQNSLEAPPGEMSSPQTAVLSSLYAVFSGDCWFKLTDGTGKTVIADLKTANDEVNYQGISPFHIVIGDASKASLQFNGESIDLAAYSSRNGRAELNLKPKDADTRGE